MRMPVLVYQTWNEPYGKTYGQPHEKEEDKDELTKAYEEIEALYNLEFLGDDHHTSQIETNEKPKSTHERFAQGCERKGFDHGWMYKAKKGLIKQNALNAFLEQCPKENLRIYPNCTAEHIKTDGGRIVSLIAIAKKRDIIRHVEIFADKFILSAGPIASSGFLLKNKIGNSSGKVGLNVSLHPSMSIIGEFTESVEGSNSAVMEHYCDHFSAEKIKKPGFMIESAFVPPSQFSLLMPDFGKENLKHVRAKYDYVSMAGVFVHDDAVGKVSLDANKDPILNYELSKNDRKKMVDGLRATAEIYFEVDDIKKVTTGHNVPIILKNKKEIEKKLTLNSVEKGKISCISAHPQGGNQMGTDPKTSVVNPYGQSHDIPNLYICDASIFPTSLGVNPQLTVMAIAKLVASKIYD